MLVNIHFLSSPIFAVLLFLMPHAYLGDPGATLRSAESTSGLWFWEFPNNPRSSCPCSHRAWDQAVGWECTEPEKDQTKTVCHYSCVHRWYWRCTPTYMYENVYIYMYTCTCICSYCMILIVSIML